MKVILIYLTSNLDFFQDLGYYLTCVKTVIRYRENDEVIGKLQDFVNGLDEKDSNDPGILQLFTSCLVNDDLDKLANATDESGAQVSGD